MTGHVVPRLVAEVLERAPDELATDMPLTALGLDSLRAVELRARLGQEAGLDVPLRSLLAGATIADLLAVPPESTVDTVDVLDTEPVDDGALTAGEEAVLFLDELAGDHAPTTVATAFAADGPLDVAAVRAAVDVLATRHAALRTRFTVEGGRARRTVGAAAVEVELVDAGSWSAPRLDAALGRLAETPVRVSGPTWWLHLFRLGPDRHVVLLRTHHALADLWSLDLLLAEFGEVYAAPVSARPGPADPMSRMARRERELLASVRGERLWDWWRARLADAPRVLTPPADHARPTRPRHRGTVLTTPLDPVVVARVAALADATGTSAASVLLAAYGWLLHRHCGQRDLLVGTVYANRGLPERHGVVGYLANVLPLRLRARPSEPFRTYLARTHQESCAAMDHGELPFPTIVARLAPERDATRAPLVQAMFAAQRARADAGAAALVLGGTDAEVVAGPLRLRPWRLPRRPAVADLTLEVGERDAALTYDADLFTAETARRLLDSWLSIVERVVRDPDGGFDELTAPSATQRHRLLHEWNGPVADLPDGELLHHPFERWARRRPDAVAVEAGACVLTYGELDTLAEDLARRLRAVGVRPDQRVGVHIGRSVAYLAAILGVLKAGAAYVPLDPDLPAERLDRVRAAAGVGVVVSEDLAITGESPGEPGAAAGQGSLCYVMATSGSTGAPKAVGVPHGAVANLLADFGERGTLTEGDRCAWWTSVGFDVSVYEIFAAFHAGATVVVVPEEVRVDGAALAGWLRAHAVAAAFVPPFALAELVADLERHGTPPLRRLLLGVEPVPEALALRLTAVLPQTNVVNAYGPTETTVMCTAYPVARDELADRRLPIGRALRNTRAYVVDERGVLAPQGSVGELCVGGVQLARGYLGCPAATAERFRPDPYGRPGARLYRTGDLVRYRADGQLEFVGRADQQVKLFGQRVELGEIEAALARHPAIAEAVVVVAGTGERQHVVAHAIPTPAGGDADAVLAEVKAHLPRHMVPSRLHWHAAWPLNANGKVDRAALAATSTPAASAGTVGRRAGTWLERRVAATLASELGVPEVGLDDNFFTLGGHSLAAARAAARLRAELGVELPVAVVFQRPTAGELAEFTLAAGAAPRTGLSRRPRGAASIEAMRSTVEGDRG